MFISHEHSLIFFEVPRTGSRSITQALTSLDPSSPTAIIRSVKRNLYHYHVFDRTVLEKYPKYRLIAVHRNPFERIRSHYKYRKQHGNPDELKQFEFTDYVHWVCEGTLPFAIGPAMIDKPITELLPCEKVDHFLSFDALNEEWELLGRELDIQLPSLPAINGSKGVYDQESGYTVTLADKIRKRFESDFEYFGYDIEISTE